MRCIKSNKAKKPDNFSGADVLRQLRYSGLLGVCLVRKAGYAYRNDHATFVKKYSQIAGGKATPAEIIKEIVAKGWLAEKQIALGKTIVFMKVVEPV